MDYRMETRSFKSVTFAPPPLLPPAPSPLCLYLAILVKAF